MISLMIVDDEDISKNNLYKNISAMELPFEAIYTASNGETALNKLKGKTIDILLTDVKMPKMDGIELATVIREKYPDCRIIFLSGYDEKEYLKYAIKLHAVEYLEKPVKYEILYNILKAVAEEMDKEQQHIDIQRFYNESLPIVRHNFAIRITMFEKNKENIDNAMQVAGLANIKKYKKFRTFILSDSKDGFKELYNKIESELESFGTEYDFGILSALKEDRYLVIHMAYDELTDDIIQTLLSEIFDKFKLNCRIGAGDEVSSVYEIYDSYQSAAIRWQRSFLSGYNEFTNKADESKVYSDAEKVKEEIINAVAQLDKAVCSELLVRLENDLSNCGKMTVSGIKDIYSDIAAQIFEFINENEIHTNITQARITNEISEANILNELTVIFRKLLSCVWENVNTEDINYYCWRAMRYINENYKNPSLSVQEIADYAGVSVTHITNLFKQHTKQTINKYIREYRMEKAKKLLKNTNRTVAKIAAEVGYIESKYFCKQFKSYASMSPMEYRGKV